MYTSLENRVIMVTVVKIRSHCGKKAGIGNDTSSVVMHELRKNEHFFLFQSYFRQSCRQIPMSIFFSTL